MKFSSLFFHDSNSSGEQDSRTKTFLCGGQVLKIDNFVMFNKNHSKSVVSLLHAESDPTVSLISGSLTLRCH